MTPRYRHLFYDLLTGAPIKELALSGVSYGGRISDVGGFKANVTIPWRGKDTQLAQNVRDVFPGYDLTSRYNKVPPRRLISLRSTGGPYVPWWGGLVQAASDQTDDTGGVQLSLVGASWETWLHMSILEVDLPDQLQVDQYDIARSLWIARQSMPGGNIGVELGSEASGVLRDRTQYQMSRGLILGDLMANLANVINGFEYTVDTYASGGTYHAKLRLAEKISGSAVPPLFTFSPGAGGNVNSWGGSSDYTQGATVFYARGQADDANAVASVQNPVSAPQAAQDLLDAGWPRIVTMDDYSSVSDVSVLNSKAQAARDQRSGVAATNTAEVSLLKTSWNPSMRGSVHRFKLRTALTPGIEVQRRVVGWQLTAAEGSAPEKVTLEFESPGGVSDGSAA